MSDPVPPLPGTEVPTPNQARRLHLAFQSVYGQPGKSSRTSDQRLVLKHMNKVCCVGVPKFQRDPTTGLMDPYAAAQRDGASTYPLVVARQLELARTDPEGDEPKKKPKVKR